MLQSILVILTISAALIFGAVWGAWLPLPARVKGAMIAFAGGALIISLTFELFEPAVDKAGLTIASLSLLAGALVFTVADYLVDERWGDRSGGGLLAAVTLDGIPENVALGVALVGASLGSIAPLAASIFLSNLPEAAGGAQSMKKLKWSGKKIVLVWTIAAVLLSLAAILGNLVMEFLSDEVVAGFSAFAAGAVLASLATEVFPQAFRESHHEAGIATALGLILAFMLGA